MTFLIYEDNETRYHQIDSKIGPTMNIFEMKDKTKIPKCVILFIFPLEYFHCGCDYAVNFKLMKVD